VWSPIFRHKVGQGKAEQVAACQWCTGKGRGKEQFSIADSTQRSYVTDQHEYSPGNCFSFNFTRTRLRRMTRAAEISTSAIGPKPQSNRYNASRLPRPTARRVGPELGSFSHTSRLPACTVLHLPTTGRMAPPCRNDMWSLYALSRLRT